MATSLEKNFCLVPEESATKIHFCNKGKKIIGFDNFQEDFIINDGEYEKKLLIEGIKPFVKKRFLIARSDESFNEDSFYIALRDASSIFQNIDLNTIKKIMIECIREETQNLIDQIWLVQPQYLKQISTLPKDRRK